MTNKNAYYKSDLGIIKIIYDQNLIGIELTEKVKGENHKSDLSDKIYEQINGCLKGKVKTFDIYDSLQISGTAFQKSVWEELIKIPYGETKTYKEIAQKINKPKAVRAVANAIGKNPFFIIIPCHRVIRNDGTMGGFAYGPDTKEKLLDLENKY